MKDISVVRNDIDSEPTSTFNFGEPSQKGEWDVFYILSFKKSQHVSSFSGSL